MSLRPASRWTDFTLPAELEAHDPPEARGLARDQVRLLVSRGSSGQISHHGFGDLPGLLLPGDLLVVNTSGTLPAQVRAGGGLAVHFSTQLPDGAWLTELRQVKGKISVPNGAGYPGQVIGLPGGAALTLNRRAAGRLWRARLSVAVVPYLLQHGIPIRYSYVRRDWPLQAYQTVFARHPGSAEMPSASRPFTTAMVTDLVARGVLIAPLTLHTGVSSLEADEDPYPEPYDVPPATARLVNHVRAARRAGHRRGHHRGAGAGDGVRRGWLRRALGRLDVARGDAADRGAGGGRAAHRAARATVLASADAGRVRRPGAAQPVLPGGRHVAGICGTSSGTCTCCCRDAGPGPAPGSAAVSGSLAPP